MSHRWSTSLVAEHQMVVWKSRGHGSRSRNLLASLVELSGVQESVAEVALFPPHHCLISSSRISACHEDDVSLLLSL